MAAGSANAIDVGDAVFNFIANTQDLDTGLAKVEAIPGVLAPADVALQATAENWQFAGETAAVASVEMEAAGDEAVAAGQKALTASYEARGEVRLIGEEIGVQLPRHVAGFLAQLPGVGEALEAAFSATAVLFLLQALVQVTEKLSEWVGSTLIFTQAMKDAQAAIVATNLQVAAQAAAFDKAKDAADNYGKTAAEQTAEKIDNLTGTIKKNQETIDNNSNSLYLLRNGLNEYAVNAEAAQNQINLLTASNKALNEQLQVLQQQQTDQLIEQQNKRISIQKSNMDSSIELTRAEALMKLAITGGSYSQELAIQQAADQQMYKVEADSIAQRIALLAIEGDKTKIEREQLYSQLEKLAADHNAKVYELYAQVFNTIKQQAKDLDVSMKDISGDIANDLTRSLDQASAAAKALGFTFSGDLELKVLSTKDAYDKLKSSGQATYGDLLKGQKELLQAQIAYDKVFGVNTKDEQKELNNVNAAYTRLTNAADKFSLKLHGPVTNSMRAFDQILKQSGSSSAAWGAAVGAAIADVEAAYAQGSVTIGKALEDVAAAQLKAIASIAEKKGTEQLAEGFGSYPDFGAMAHHFGAAALWFSLGGALSIGAGALSGGSGSGSSAASGAGGVPRDNSPATATQQQPTQTVNIQRFAAGGLVTGPTLAIIGDSVGGGSAREAVLPLDHPDTIKAIVDALQKAGGGGSAQVTNINVKGMISSDNLKTVVKKINKQVNKGQVGLTASNTYRVTKRSQ